MFLCNLCECFVAYCDGMCHSGGWFGGGFVKWVFL